MPSQRLGAFGRGERHANQGLDVIEGQDFRRFGPYVLLRCSGAGGFGRIDLALKGRPELAKVCVVKRMQKGDHGPETEARFRREAQIALQLSHGAIAQTVGVEEIEGELCLLQEFVDGVNLRHLQSQCTPELVPLPVALYIVREVSRALAYAHGFGIVHRDVTPDNVMLSFDGQVKLVDFGIARGLDDTTLTHTGVVVGRETYTAPEVWAGGKADARADIFSLGVVLWQLVTGRSFQDVQNEEGKETPDPCGVNGNLARELGDVVLRALATEPKERVQSAGELLEALGTFLPAGFVAEPALAAVLARYFNVERERKILADDVEAAKRLLVDAEDTRDLRSATARSVRRGVGGVMVGTALALLVGVVVARTIGHPGGRTATEPPGGMVAGSQRVAEGRSFPASVTRRSNPPDSTAQVVPDKGPLAAPAPGAATPFGEVRADKAGEPKVARARRPPPPRLAEDSRAEGRKPAGGATATAANASGRELLERARERWDTDDVDGALVLAKQAAAAGGGGDAHVLIGTVFLKKKQRREAEREFEEALRLNPENAKASRLLQLARGGGTTGD